MLLNRRSLLRSAGYLGGAATFSKLMKPSFAQSSSRLSMQMDWILDVQFAGVLMAQHRGLFAQSGLDVDIKPWSSGLVVTESVSSDPMTLGCVEQNLVLAAQAEGKPIRAVAAMLQASPLCVMTMPDSGLESVSDLVGQKVGMHVDGLKVINLTEGISGLETGSILLEEVPYESKEDRLISGEYAGIQGYATNEPLIVKGKIGQLPNVIKLSDFGYEAYAQVVIAHQDLIESQPELITKFLADIFSGWEYSLGNQEETSAIIIENFNNELDLEQQIESIKLTQDYVVGQTDTPKLGVIDPDRWQRMSRLMAEYQIISEEPNIEDSLNSSLWS